MQMPTRFRITDVAAAMDQWSKRAFHIEHYYELLALTQADLYDGEGPAAHARLVERWGPFRRSLLQTVQMVGAMALQLRARSALGAATDPAKVPALLASAERDARALERVRMAWATPMAKLLRAGVVVTRRPDDARAVALLREAIVGFEAAEMTLYAAATKRMLGRLQRGGEGLELVQEVDEWMSAQTIKNPAKMAAMLAPGFHRLPNVD